MKIIVNADDFGINKPCTDAIVKCFSLGLLSQTTTMVNMPYYESSVEVAKANGFYGRVGLHFNLTEGIPLTKEMRECSFFCSEDGSFSGDFHRLLKTRLVISRHSAEALKKEAIAQFERYLDSGYTMMHLDSHHHVHTDFSVAKVLLPLARQYGFKTVRISRTISKEKISVLKRVYKAVYNAYVCYSLKPLSNEFTDFEDFMAFYNCVPRNSTVEIMVHPGQGSDPSNDDQSRFWRAVNKYGIEVCHD